MTFDPGYLLAEIEELQRIAKRAGFGTLEYMLECAAIDARAQIVCADGVLGQRSDVLPVVLKGRTEDGLVVLKP